MFVDDSKRANGSQDDRAEEIFGSGMETRPKVDKIVDDGESATDIANRPG